MTIIVAIPLIGLTGINLSYAGNLIVTTTKIIMVKLEKRKSNRECVKLCSKKVFAIQCVLMLLAWFFFSLVCILSSQMKPLDAIYFIFITLTTIGLGDITFPNEGRERERSIMALLSFVFFNLAMATVASVVTIVTEIIKNMKLKKLGTAIRKKVSQVEDKFETVIMYGSPFKKE